jgi:hypothetical protein
MHGRGNSPSSCDVVLCFKGGVVICSFTPQAGKRTGEFDSPPMSLFFPRLHQHHLVVRGTHNCFYK